MVHKEWVFSVLRCTKIKAGQFHAQKCLTKKTKNKQKKAGMIERLQTNELAWQCAPERFGLLTAMFNYNMASLDVKDVDRSRQF